MKGEIRATIGLLVLIITVLLVLWLSS